MTARQPDAERDTRHVPARPVYRAQRDGLKDAADLTARVCPTCGAVVKSGQYVCPRCFQRLLPF